MHKLAILLVSFALAPAPAPAPSPALPQGALPKIPVRLSDVGQQAKLPPLLSPKQLAIVALEKTKAKAKAKDGPQLDSVIAVSPSDMREGDVFASYFCTFAIWGGWDNAMFTRSLAAACSPRFVGATIDLPVTAGRVYVVNCQTGGGTWEMGRWDGSNVVGPTSRESRGIPTFVVAATETRTETVAFRWVLDLDDDVQDTSIGKCQVGRVAI